MFFRYQLAEALNKTVDEITNMSRSEYIGWSEYYRIRADEQKKASMKRGKH